MRMDDDSYFTESIKNDFFVEIHNQSLDYGFRAIVWDIKLAGSEIPRILTSYRKQCIIDCFPFISHDAIYTNFFITRISFWHQPVVKNFIQKLVNNDTIIMEGLGDGNIHAAVLALASNTKQSKMFYFSYGHNSHLYRPRNKIFHLDEKHQWLKSFDNTCDKLIIIDPITNQLKKIQMKKRSNYQIDNSSIVKNYSLTKTIVFVIFYMLLLWNNV
ncbi:unnamed protein product [Didymodactylos carnosus]|nr:unnamed protein product [Didymodactylos carnosus]CAF4487422.1 unnamed protein product [Didymodactylos carnosus]